MSKLIYLDRKGISTFVATLLLIVLAVGAGLVIYAYNMGYLGNFSGVEEISSLSLDSADIDGNLLTAYIRNTGKKSVVFDTIYVNGEKQLKSPLIYINDVYTEGELKEGEVAMVLYSTNFVSGQNYEIKLICKDASKITFNVKA